MARALIVGCGCRGRELARALQDDGWLVRGTTRDPDRLADIEAVGAAAVVADPDRLNTVLDHIADVAVVYWLLGSATGQGAAIGALHSERLESLLGRVVDSPLRGFVYEAAGSVDAQVLNRGAEIVRAAGERWRIPVTVVECGPDEPEAWLEAMLAATGASAAGSAGPSAAPTEPRP